MRAASRLTPCAHAFRSTIPHSAEAAAASSCSRRARPVALTPPLGINCQAVPPQWPPWCRGVAQAAMPPTLLTSLPPTERVLAGV